MHPVDGHENFFKCWDSWPPPLHDHDGSVIQLLHGHVILKEGAKKYKDDNEHKIALI